MGITLDDKPQTFNRNEILFSSRPTLKLFRGFCGLCQHMMSGKRNEAETSSSFWLLQSLSCCNSQSVFGQSNTDVITVNST